MVLYLNGEKQEIFDKGERAQGNHTGNDSHGTV